VSSTATVIGAPAGTRDATTNPAATSPTCPGHHRAAEKNRCARQWCQTRARPAPVKIPHTVRSTGWATNPATSAVNVSNVGAVKHGRNDTSTRDSVDGRIKARSIGGTLFRRSRDQHRRCSTHHSLEDPRDTPVNAELFRPTPSLALIAAPARSAAQDPGDGTHQHLRQPPSPSNARLNPKVQKSSHLLVVVDGRFVSVESNDIA